MWGGPSRRVRALLRGVLVATALASVRAAPLWAQVTAPDSTGVDGAAGRVEAAIDYVSADGLYLNVGADQGAVLGDTVTAYGSAGGDEVVGRLVLVSVTRRRSVAQMADGSAALVLGDVVYLALDAPNDVPDADASITPTLAQAPSAPRPSTRRDTGPRLTGRLGMDLDVRETRTSWQGDLSGDVRRRFATPTARLSLRATGLPGGFTLRMNVRAEYRYDDIALGPPPTSVRAYEAAMSREFSVVPVQVTLGRFANPYEAYSAYWDGALLRIGGRAGGIGVVAGFEPDRSDEGISTDIRKLTAFADLALRGDSWRYAADASAHVLRAPDGVDRSYVGWTQRISAGPISLTQRLRLDGAFDGARPRLGQLRVRAGWRVSRALSLRATYGRSRPSPSVGLAVSDTLLYGLPSREEATVGFDLDGRRASFGLDAGRTRREGEPDSGFSLGGRVGLATARAQLALSGRHWMRGSQRSSSVSPTLSVRIGDIDWRAGYRHYRNDVLGSTLVSHTAELGLAMEILRDVRLTAGAERQWGANLSGTRLRVGLWRSF